MALTDLVQALERDAAEQVRALLEAAASAAAHLEAQAARRRDEASTHALDAWRDECRAGADERAAKARRAARARVLTARAAMLDRVRAALLVQLPAVADRVRPALQRAALACAGARPGVSREVPTGIVIELPNGTEIVATLEALVERDWPQLATRTVAFVGEELTS